MTSCSHTSLNGCSWSLGVVHSMRPGPRFFSSCGSFHSGAVNLLVIRGCERAWRNRGIVSGVSKGQTKKGLHHFCLHLLPGIQSQATTATRAWEVRSNSTPKKREQAWWLTAGISLSAHAKGSSRSSRGIYQPSSG